MTSPLCRSLARIFRLPKGAPHSRRSRRAQVLKFQHNHRSEGQTSRRPNTSRQRQGIKELLPIVVDDADARLPVDVTRQGALLLGRLSSSSPVVLFAQMMFADQVYRACLRSFFTELFCEAYF